MTNYICSCSNGRCPFSNEFDNEFDACEASKVHSYQTQHKAYVYRIKKTFIVEYDNGNVVEQ